MKRYRCNDCGYEWKDESEISEMPECPSDNWYCGSKDISMIEIFAEGEWYSLEPVDEKVAQALANDPLR